MSFPITINAAASAIEQPSHYGPWFHGADIYVLNYLADSPPQLIMEKSTDGGATWAVVGTGPTVLDGTSFFGFSKADYVVACACQSTADATKLYVCYLTVPDMSSNVFVAMTPFTMGGDTWGSPVVSADGLLNPATISCCAYRQADNSIIVAGYGFSIVTLEFLDHLISSYIVLDVTGGTWNTLADLGYQDYTDMLGGTLWNQRPCGIVCDSSGNTHVFMQQLTKLSSTDPVVVSTNEDLVFTAPGDCFQLDDVESWGGGGAGGSKSGFANGGGGGASYEHLTSLAVTPGTSYPITIGLGAQPIIDADGAIGAQSDIDGNCIAVGGLGGTQQTGGAGGIGSELGGDGGDGNPSGQIPHSGGGGGAAGGPLGPGLRGTDGDLSTGGPGGTGADPAGSGGSGGFDVNTASPDGQIGQTLGGGGGGSSGQFFVDEGRLSIGGAGADGLLRFQYTRFTNSHPGRLWQQAIHSDNSLGTLSEITEGSCPIGNGPFQFDVKVSATQVAIAFSGVTATLNDDMSVGKATNGPNVLTFSFQTVSAGNSGSEIAPAPAIAWDGTDLYLAYLSAPDIATVHYLSRKDSGSGFGPPGTIGTFADAGCRIATEFHTSLRVTFGTPTTASTRYAPAESPEFLQFDYPIGGLDGNLVTMKLTAVLNGATTVTVTPSDVNQFLIEVSYGYTVDGFGDKIPDGGSWDGLAAIINASASADIVTATGYSGFSPGAGNTGTTGTQQLSGGSSGASTPTYFAGDVEPPPHNIILIGPCSMQPCVPTV